ncbi:hypothetical protein LTR99_003291 [Exophiala xenobiotica]|uniref:alpha-1,2-Mannosidase n=1 Tax=Vermiconidia calcicola TaxID=1690605 RepID=A0AAV9QD06_9PEZI|nr:hypothetical protein LTR72_009068 [Exophiala xenobiotica]KAK5538958.1 hypothetical protein LTR25_004502 [Vermiconidia calcicola]KAK5540472.1 hypothetical protein LTR23_006154 [Chaetothyriales sp. CCFEE 6169]KAK5266554.1 hypothetical protein LTR96_008401 [Exophiala xenobiotica]KAK5288586.1 hypothetical protein LTR14_007936 [Exophiala xenobiotica]
MSWSKVPQKKLVKILLSFFTVLLVLYFLTTGSSKPTQIQYKFKRKSLAQHERQDAVKREFLHAWTGYQDHAWMADGLLPLSGGRRQQFCGWSATLVDALDTLIIMGLDEEFQEALNATLTIDFADSIGNCNVNLFESTIRYLGGLMAAYDLSNDARILPKLVELGDMLHSAFNTSNGMPCTMCKLATADAVIESSEDAALADVGSLYLEFARLSQVTGDEKYMHTIDVLSEVFARSQNDSSIPGLWPEMLNPRVVGGPQSYDFARKSSRYALGAMSDSTYEYLVKAHLFMGKTRHIYRSMWELASRQIKRYLLFRAFIPGANDTDIIFPGIATRDLGARETLLETRTEHLACFAGGMFAMAARIFDNPEDFSIAEQITNGCVWAYQNSPTGIMPETLTLLPCSTDDGQQCEWSDEYWTAQSNRSENCMNGNCQYHRFPPGILQVKDPSYKLRPEAIESVFIMWRMTGDEYWREVGWEMFENIIEHTRSPFGHAALMSTMEVYQRDTYEKGLMVRKVLARQIDDMESFWFAETLKYFYLLFSDPNLISLDEWVLNTEAHPFRLTEGIRGF